jgi:hypothetical protein
MHFSDLHYFCFVPQGNRDVNKLRFSSELATTEIGRPIDVYWDPKAKKFEDFCKEQGISPNNMISMLKWMLFCTMGSQTTFETRRTELGILRGLQPSDVSDHDVFQSFYDSVNMHSADPWMLNFIREGQIAALVGDCLFVHGGVGIKQMGAVPGSTTRYHDVAKWVEALNAWGRSQVKEFEAQPIWTEKNGKVSIFALDHFILIFLL